ncbi:MAG TPA: hypothetical protein VEB22_07470 [Phycisphaerales bacterium]|nr:hypothetical protein [Phycisphaerales bacterium]
MTWEFSEGAVRAVAAYLAAVLPARLDLIDTQYAGDAVPITLDDFTIEEGELVEVQAHKYPLIELTVARTVANAADGTYLKATQDVLIRGSISDAKPVYLRRRVYRSARAIVECFSQGRAGQHALIGGASWSASYGTPLVDYSEAFRQRGVPQPIAAFTVRITMTRTEL